MRGAREASAPRESLKFRRASRISRNECESGTFTIVLHATSSFTYVSVIYGANFPFNLQLGCYPLHWACLGKNLEVVKLLLDKGADLELERDVSFDCCHDYL